MRFITLAAVVLLAGIVAVAAGVGVLFAYVARDLPSPEKFSERQVAESTKIFDRTGTVLLYDIHGEEKRTVIGPGEIPDVVKKATIAVEDANFYGHIGVEPKAILRAAYANIRNRTISQGGSTITQQLIGNTLTSRKERTLTRKIKDAILAIELEQRYSKDEILAFYLNQIPYGSNAYGVEAASQTFFGKHAKELTMAQAATIAGLPKAPTFYSPYGSNRERLMARKDFVLGCMKELSFISPEQYDAAKGETIEFIPLRQEIRAPHFVFHVRELLEELYGQEYLEEGGLSIITSLDWDLQQKAEALVKDYAMKNEKQFKAKNAALVAVNPENGDVLSMVGSRDYFDESVDGNVNVATRLRQPGSSFKPFAYATAFEKGYTPNTVVFDLETNFAVEGAAPYAPKNYDGEFRGPVTLREALAQSLNIPSVKVLYLAGVEDTIKTAEAMGITSLKDRSRFGLSLVLGGGEVTLLEETAAYSAFAADGMFRQSRPILSINDVAGAVVKEYTVEERKALELQIARSITDILSDNNARTPTFGAQSPLIIGDNVPIAAKTGTTQENHDAWVVGYTTGIAGGVWVGNNDNSPMTQKGAGISAAGPLWHDFMQYASTLYAARPFVKPDPVVTGKSMLDGSVGDVRKVPFDKITGKRATEFTPRQMIDERAYTQVHAILHYVQKDDPLAAAPEDPGLDPQYWSWEHTVEQWALTENATKGTHYNEQPPEEYDDMHTVDSQPTVQLRTPAPQDRLYARTVTLTADVQAPRKLERVEFYFDNFFVGSDFIAPYAYIYTLPAKVIGEAHAFTARAYDDIGNTAEDRHEVTIDAFSGVAIEPEFAGPTDNAGNTDTASTVTPSVEGAATSVDGVMAAGVSDGN